MARGLFGHWQRLNSWRLLSASVLKNRRMVFIITGDDDRLIVAIAYKLQIVCVKLVGGHKGYDAVDAQAVETA